MQCESLGVFTIAYLFDHGQPCTSIDSVCLVMSDILVSAVDIDRSVVKYDPK